MHEQSHNALRISERLDHHALMSVYEQAKWLTGIPVKCFWQVGDDALPYDEQKRPMHVDENHPAVKRSVAFLQPLAEAYSKGEIKTRDQLVEAKTKKFTEWKAKGLAIQAPPRVKKGNGVATAEAAKQSATSEDTIGKTTEMHTEAALPPASPSVKRRRISEKSSKDANACSVSEATGATVDAHKKKGSSVTKQRRSVCQEPPCPRRC